VLLYSFYVYKLNSTYIRSITISSFSSKGNTHSVKKVQVIATIIFFAFAIDSFGFLYYPELITDKTFTVFNCEFGYKVYHNKSPVICDSPIYETFLFFGLGSVSLGFDGSTGFITLICFTALGIIYVFYKRIKIHKAQKISN
jgi:hypothetical protein